MLIAQLSDPHLRPRGVLYQGLVDSNAMFAEALRTLRELDPAPDVVIVSGDLVDEGIASEYALAAEMLARIEQPVLLIPGNHDRREAFRAGLARHGGYPDSGPLHGIVDDLGPVRIILLDITVPGAHHGLFDEAAAQWLKVALDEAPERPTVIVMHQPPVTCGIPYLDPYFCRDGDRLGRLVWRYPNVERVLCGHVHRTMQVRFGGTLLCTAPSTTTAIALRLGPEAKPASFIEPPAFLLHHWDERQPMITHHVPIGRFQGPLPFA